MHLCLSACHDGMGVVDAVLSLTSVPRDGNPRDEENSLVSVLEKARGSRQSANAAYSILLDVFKVIEEVRIRVVEHIQIINNPSDLQ